MGNNILEYKDPKFLNTLALRTIGIKDKSAGFSITFMPDVNELMDVVEYRKRVEIDELGMKSYDHFVKMELEKAAYFKKIHELCVEHQISPFVGPIFDGRVVGPPEFEYRGWSYRPTQDFSREQNEKFKNASDELGMKSADAFNFFGNNKWYFIEFKDIRGEKDKGWGVERLAEITKRLIGEGYRVTGLIGGLNLLEHDHFTATYETSFIADRGNIQLYGSIDLPEDFDIEGAVGKHETETLEGFLEGLPNSVAAVQ